MPRRSDPDRIATAMEAGTRARLRDTLPGRDVDALLAEWAVVAEERGLRRQDSAYWDAAVEWVLEQAQR